MGPKPKKPKATSIDGHVMRMHRAGATVEDIVASSKLNAAAVQRIIKFWTPAEARCPPGCDPVKWAAQQKLRQTTADTVSVADLQRLAFHGGQRLHSTAARAADLDDMKHKMEDRDGRHDDA